MPEKKIIVVLGMHRSGTSVLARGIVALGAHPGNHLFPEDEGNAKGYWENAEIVALNEKILKRFLMKWHTLDNLLINRFELLLPLYESHFLDEAKRIITENLSSSDLLMIKDPRMSILLPFWRKVFAELPVSVKYVLALRNPLETAKSVQKRNRISVEQGIKLWSYYNMMILKNVKQDFLVCFFENLMTNPRHELERIRAFAELERIFERDVKEYCHEFLERSLVHHHADDGQLSRLVGENTVILDLYETLKRWAQENPIDSRQAVEFVLKHEEEFSAYLGYSNKETAGNETEENDVRVFLDYGRGYSEQDSFKYALDSVVNQIEMNADQLRNFRNLVLMPSRHECIFVLERAVFRKDGQEVKIRRTGGNYQHHFGNVYIFENEHPQFYFLPGEIKPTHAIIRFKVYKIDEHTFSLLSKLNLEMLQKQLDELLENGQCSVKNGENGYGYGNGH